MSRYLSPSVESLSLYSFTMVVQLECIAILYHGTVTAQYRQHWHLYSSHP